MICPTCGTVNRDDARTCRECGIRLTGRNMRPADAAKEKKYLRIGALAAAGILALAILLLCSMCKVCGGCSCGKGGEDAVNENVGGDWSVVETVSGADISGADALGEPAVEEPAE